MPEDPALLEWLLDLSDSIITYRARYMRHAEWLAVADLLLFDRRNPRSAAFQLAKLAKHVPLLPGRRPRSTLVRAIERAVRDGASADHDRRASCSARADTIDRVPARLPSTWRCTLSDALTLRYFSHVYESGRTRRAAVAGDG